MIRSFPYHETILCQLARVTARKSIRHGDLARWNLLRTDDGRLKVLDWEWGEPNGLAGIDLVHYLAQDFRLVKRMAATSVVEATVNALKSPFWHSYLESTGWSGRERELVLACLAFKQGAGHQDNSEILRTCVKSMICS